MPSKETPKTTTTKVLRSGAVDVKTTGTFSGWIWKRKWLVLGETTLALHKGQPSAQSSARPQKTFQLRDLTTVERTDLKPFCVLLKFTERPGARPKTYLLSFESDQELYKWHDDMYDRSALGGETSGPSGFVHHVHVGFDPMTSGFTGLPDGWEQAVSGPTPRNEKRNSLTWHVYDSTSGNTHDLQVTTAAQH